MLHRRFGQFLETQPQLAGITCITLGMLAISCNDAIIKWISPHYPVHEIVLLRSVISVIFVTSATWMTVGLASLRSSRPGIQLVRGCLMVFANMAFFLSLAELPLADATALFFVAPLFITLLSVPVLKEKVGIRRRIAIVVGFAGVMVIVRPGAGIFQIAALLPIIAAALYACMQMLTRKIGTRDSAAAMSLYIQCTLITVSAGFGLTVGDGRFAGGDSASLNFLFRAWNLPTGEHLGLIFLCGLLIGAGGYLLSQAYRVAEANIIAPFEYSALPWAVILGFVIMGELPDLTTWIGITLIITSGLYILYRENLKRSP